MIELNAQGLLAIQKAIRSFYEQARALPDADQRTGRTTAITSMAQEQDVVIVLNSSGVSTFDAYDTRAYTFASIMDPERKSMTARRVYVDGWSKMPKQSSLLPRLYKLFGRITYVLVG